MRRANEQLRKENAQLKQEMSRLAAEMAEIRKLVSSPLRRSPPQPRSPWIRLRHFIGLAELSAERFRTHKKKRR
ncbi:hypothetical protein MRX96_050165 [Rhipicephalus microplus]